tara:strand:- start:480 stop:1265 length:786 start_codon:yes stop_codon:yes gene_type:complete
MSNEIAVYSKEYYPQIRAVIGAEEAPDTVVETAVEYCKAAGLDIMRKPVAIISYGGKHQIVFTIQAITTVASRAGWCGSDEIAFSDKTVKVDGKDYPAFGYQVVYKMIQGQRCAFTGPKVYLTERHKGSWKMAGVMTMFQKCVTSAALRLAFPEELAHAFVEDEMFTEYSAVESVDNSGIEALKAGSLKKAIAVVVEEEEEASTINNLVDDYIELLEAAPDMETLKGFGVDIGANEAFTAKEKAELKKVYLEKQKEFNNGV